MHLWILFAHLDPIPFALQLSIPSNLVKKGWTSTSPIATSQVPPKLKSFMQPLYYVESKATLAMSAFNNTIVAAIWHLVCNIKNAKDDVYLFVLVAGEEVCSSTTNKRQCKTKDDVEDIVVAAKKIPKTNFLQ